MPLLTEPPLIALIRPARWFKHALSIGDLCALLGSRLRALECARDARAPFCAARLAALRHVERLLETRAFGGAEAWVERLEIEHVHQYLRAADSWDRGDVSLTPAPWRAIFVRERQRQATVAQSLRAGTTAHLAYDLPLALARIGTHTLERGDAGASYGRLTRVYVSTAAEALLEAVSRNGRARMPGLGHPRRGVPAAWQRELRAQAWDDAASLADPEEHAREVAFGRIELGAVCEIGRVFGRAPLA